MIDLYFSAPELVCFDNDAAPASDSPNYRAQLAKTEKQLTELVESNNLSERERENLEQSLEETRSEPEGARTLMRQFYKGDHIPGAYVPGSICRFLDGSYRVLTSEETWEPADAPPIFMTRQADDDRTTQTI